MIKIVGEHPSGARARIEQITNDKKPWFSIKVYQPGETIPASDIRHSIEAAKRFVREDTPRGGDITRWKWSEARE